MREIKFRIPMFTDKGTFTEFQYLKLGDDIEGTLCGHNGEPQQYTGLTDKDMLQDIYEGDIIDTYGKIKGNIYEMDKGETDIVIQGFGTSKWESTNKEAMERGCKYSE